jgi:predicted DCC family thiol-disulfide oxidoreductase YuxK|tara:strand:- start:724 stop:1095 length:372 start_codon:yes stop_codon:yes gene_type:complete
MISVFYDDKCSLCAREIKFYKKIAPRDSCKWVGLSSSPKELRLKNIRIVDALMYLHAKDCEGNFHIGVDAFILIWAKLSYFKYLNYIISLPVIYQFACFFYDKFAKYRFNRLEHCQVALKKTR